MLSESEASLPLLSPDPSPSAQDDNAEDIQHIGSMTSWRAWRLGGSAVASLRLHFDQHVDVWNSQAATGDSSYFGKLPPQVVENLLQKRLSDCLRGALVSVLAGG